MRRILVFAACAAAAACGGPDEARHVRPDGCDATVLGACVASEVPIDAPHLERQLRMALDYWEAPESALDGWAIVLTRDPVPCPEEAGAGCTWWDEREKTVQLQALDPTCPETAQLVHELGHVLFHDGGHRGPWWSWCGEQEATERIVRAEGASPACLRSRHYAARALDAYCGRG